MNNRAIPGRPVTIKTIAEAAGTHPSTVSRALNPATASMVGAETVRRVQEIAASFGYEPNPWARSLRTNKTMTIGGMLPRLTERVLAQLKAHLSEIPAERFKTPMKVADIPRLFTPETFCKLVISAQREAKAAA